MRMRSSRSKRWSRNDMRMMKVLGGRYHCRLVLFFRVIEMIMMKVASGFYAQDVGLRNSLARNIMIHCARRESELISFSFYCVSTISHNKTTENFRWGWRAFQSSCEALTDSSG